MIMIASNRTDSSASSVSSRSCASRAVITSLVMAAVLFSSARGVEVASPSQPPVPAPAPTAIVLTPPTGTVGARGTGDSGMPGTDTSVLELTLPERTNRKFARGGVIEVPANTMLTKVNLTVAASESSWIDEQDLLLELHDGQRNRAVMASNVSVVTIDGLKVARFVATDVADPLVVTADSPLRVRGVIRKRRITQEWTLQASASPSRFISEQAGTHEGVRLTIAIDEPIAPPILLRDMTTMDVTVKGQVKPAAGLTRLVVAGIEVPPDRTEASQTFAVTVPIDASMREFVVEASDKFGRTASVVIPIAVPAAMRKNRDASK
jgi:hypothetical protein